MQALPSGASQGHRRQMSSVGKLAGPGVVATTVRAPFHNRSTRAVSPLVSALNSLRKGDVTLLFAIDISTWPGVNQAFLFSFFLAVALTLLAIPYGKRRPIGTPFSWGE